MSSNGFKKTIQDRYKGRGNSWVKVLKDQKGANQIEDLLLNVPDSEKSSYIEHTTREGFYWIRYSKVEGDESVPLVRFEVRFKDSKEDHPESFVLINDAIAKDFELLGNTPVKMQIEVKPENRKAKKEVKPIRQRQKSSETENDMIDIVSEIRVIKEASLSKPTSHELEEWYDFLRVNNLYEENV